MRMRIVAIGALFGALAAAGGCGGADSRRSMDVEVESKQGRWRLEGVQAATLDMGDWKTSVTDTAIVDVKGIPYLQRFTLAIINTSPTRKLYLEPREIFIRGIEPRALWLGPPMPMVLAPGKRMSLIYDKGAGAPALLHPFEITVTVFRGPQGAEPRKAVLHLQ